MVLVDRGDGGVTFFANFRTPEDKLHDEKFEEHLMEHIIPEHPECEWCKEQETDG